MNLIDELTEAEAKALLTEICDAVHINQRYRTRDTILKRVKVEVLAGKVLRQK